MSVILNDKAKSALDQKKLKTTFVYFHFSQHCFEKAFNHQCNIPDSAFFAVHITRFSGLFQDRGVRRKTLLSFHLIPSISSSGLFSFPLTRPVDGGGA